MNIIYRWHTSTYNIIWTKTANCVLSPALLCTLLIATHYHIYHMSVAHIKWKPLHLSSSSSSTELQVIASTCMITLCYLLDHTEKYYLADEKHCKIPFFCQHQTTLGRWRMDRYIDISSLPLRMSTTGLRDYPRLDSIDLDGIKVIPLYPNGDEWYRPVIWVEGVYILHEEAISRRWEEGHWPSIWTHQDIHVLSTYSSWHNQSSWLWILIALLLKSYSHRDIESSIIPLFIWGMQQESLGRAIGMSGDDERYTCTTTNPGYILQVRRIWLCRCRWWSGSGWLRYSSWLVLIAL